MLLVSKAHGYSCHWQLPDYHIPLLTYRTLLLETWLIEIPAFPITPVFVPVNPTSLTNKTGRNVGEL